MVTHDSISDFCSLSFLTDSVGFSSFLNKVQSGNNSCEHVTCVDTLHSRHWLICCPLIILILQYAQRNPSRLHNFTSKLRR